MSLVKLVTTAGHKKSEMKLGETTLSLYNLKDLGQQF